MAFPLQVVADGDWQKVRQNTDATAQRLNPVMPNARVYNNAAITLTTGTAAFLTFNSEHWDEGNLHSTGGNTGRLTVPITGLYLVGGAVDFASNATGYRQLAIRVTAIGGGTTFIVADERPAVNGAATQITVETMYRFVAGEYAELRALQNSGGNLDVSAAGNFSPEFWMVRLGGYTNQGVT